MDNEDDYVLSERVGRLMDNLLFEADKPEVLCR